jgi:ribosomal protein L37E
MNAAAWFYGQSFNGGTRETSEARTVDCLKCGEQIDYRKGTCPHCGYVEFKTREPEEKTNVIPITISE